MNPIDKIECVLYHKHNSIVKGEDEEDRGSSFLREVAVGASHGT